jgi:hypothetical protein
MANDESDALDVLEREAKEYDKVRRRSNAMVELLTQSLGR